MGLQWSCCPSRCHDVSLTTSNRVDRMMRNVACIFRRCPWDSSICQAAKTLANVLQV